MAKVRRFQAFAIPMFAAAMLAASPYSAIPACAQQLPHLAGTPDPDNPSQITYSDAFESISAAVRFSYSKSALAQDILLLAQLPSPTLWSLNPDACRIQVWTELLDWPEPTFKKTSDLGQAGDPAQRANWAEPNFPDQFAEFHQLQIPPGRALLIDTEAIRQAGINIDEEIPVGKEYVRTPDLRRAFLVESVQYALVKPLLDTLPTAANENPEAEHARLAEPEG